MAKRCISPIQKKTLIEFLEEHPELVTNKQTNQFTNSTSSLLWQEVAKKLNAIPGAMKSWKEWRKTWGDIKSRTKKKVSENRKEANKTGGGPSNAEVVDDYDEKIIGIIGGKLVIEGLDIPELGVESSMPNMWDHQYSQELVGHEEVTIDSMDPSIPKTPPAESETSKRVKPPWRTTSATPMRTARKRIKTSRNEAALELVRVTEDSNKIQETFNNKLLEIHEENLKMRKEELQLRKQELQLKAEELEIRKEKLKFIKNEF